MKKEIDKQKRKSEAKKLMLEENSRLNDYKEKSNVEKMKPDNKKPSMNSLDFFDISRRKKEEEDQQLERHVILLFDLTLFRKYREQEDLERKKNEEERQKREEEQRKKREDDQRKADVEAQQRREKEEEQRRKEKQEREEAEERLLT
jgi:hypothetical protein